MKDQRSIPLSLQIVAVLFLLYGIEGVIGMVVRLVAGHINIDLLVLGIPTFFGLRRFSEGWRICALACIWIWLITLSIVFVFVLVDGKALIYWEVYDIRIAQLRPVMFSLICVPGFLLVLWQYRVLTHPKIRALFFPAPDGQQEISDATDSNRLALINKCVSSNDDIVHGREAYDFDSLVWRVKMDGHWTDKVVISKDAFQASCPRRRWVSEIHDFDATSGTAIIKVGEADARESAPCIRCIYSWREWNLLNNSEVRVVRICAYPNERY